MSKPGGTKIPVYAEISLAEEEKEVPPEPPFSNKRWLWRTSLMTLLIALGVQTLASMFPDAVEHVYSRDIYYYIVRTQALFNKVVGFSVGEALFFLLLVVVVGLLIAAVLHSRRKDGNPKHELSLFLLRLLWLASFGFVLFMVLWGLNYQRQPLAETLDLPRRSLGSAEWSTLRERITYHINSNYADALRDADDPGPGKISINRERLFPSIEEAFRNEELLGAASHGGFAPPKPLRFSNLMTNLGLSGIYIPYTGEANFNQHVPVSELPFAIAHEKAHQRGYAREDEANFIAFLVCSGASEAYVRYSGWLHAFHIFEGLNEPDQPLPSEVMADLDFGVRADLQEQQDFWRRSVSPTLSALMRRANDFHLRINRVTSGVENYNEDVYLIISYLLGPRFDPLIDPRFERRLDPPPLPTPDVPIPRPLDEPLTDDPLVDPTPIAPPSR